MAWISEDSLELKTETDMGSNPSSTTHTTKKSRGDWWEGKESAWFYEQKYVYIIYKDNSVIFQIKKSIQIEKKNLAHTISI